jgi:hypothetical protein
MAIFSGVIVLIGLAGLSQGDIVSGPIWGLVGAFSVVRALRSSSIVVDETGVTTRSMVRTRRYGFQDLHEAEVAVGRTGVNGFGREYLIFHRVDGGAIAFKEVNSLPAKEAGSTTIVRRAAATINQRLQKRQK